MPLLQALNDQNQAAIDECLAIEGVKDWINRSALLEQLHNPIRHFKDVKSITCLTFASVVNEARTVQQLVEAGADVVKTDSKGLSPLHYACASDIDSDAKVAYLSRRYLSSQKAVHIDSDNQVAYLIQRGASCRVVLDPEVYSTSLRLAARLNQAGRVKALIDKHGVSVNATDWLDGRTALCEAAEAGHTEAVKVLLQYPDCRVNDTMFFGTVADLAREQGHYDIAALIEDKSAGNFTKHFRLLMLFCFGFFTVGDLACADSLQQLPEPTPQEFACGAL